MSFPDGGLVWRFGSARLDEKNHDLEVDGKPVLLEDKPMDVLLCLLKAEGELVTKQELFDSVWAGRVVSDGVLSQSIWRIREVLGDADKTVVRTIHRHGFRLDVAIEIEGEAEEAGTRLALVVGSPVPGLSGWMLESRLQTRPSNELWRIRNDAGELGVLKLALDDRAARALKREVTLNKVLVKELGDNPPLVPLIEWQFGTSPQWIRMPWYPAGSLADWIEAAGGAEKIPLQDRVNIVARVAEAFAKAHALGVMHKDIKPGNLLVDDSGGDVQVLLCDFGSGAASSRARLAQAGVTVMGFTQTLVADATRRSGSGAATGTPAYLAPELLEGSAFSERSDIYSLGVMLYQLVAGSLTRPLATGWEDDVDDIGLRSIIRLACAGRPEKRLAAMHELACKLREWRPAEAEKVAAQPPSGMQKTLRRILAVAAVLTIAALGTRWVLPDHPVQNLATVHAKTEEERRVAILPFKLLGLDEQSRQVMSGLQDVLVTELSDDQAWTLVVARNLVATNLMNEEDSEIGRALRSQRLIRGSVQQLGEQLRINVQLLDAFNGTTLWAKSLHGKREELFDLQSRLGNLLHVALGGQAIRRQLPDAIDPVGYEAYLSALSISRSILWVAGNPVRINKLFEQLEIAKSRAGNYIPLHVLAVSVESSGYWWSWRSRAQAQDAVAFHLGALKQLGADEYQLAIAEAGAKLWLDDRPDLALQLLEPYRSKVLAQLELSRVYLAALRGLGRFDEVIAIGNSVVRNQPNDFLTIGWLGADYLDVGQGVSMIETFLDTSKRFPKNRIIRGYAARNAFILSGDSRFLDPGMPWPDDNPALSSAEKNEFRRTIAYQQDDQASYRKMLLDNPPGDLHWNGGQYLPGEIALAVQLHFAGGERERVQTLAAEGLRKLESWRQDSDTPARQINAALALVLLDRRDEAAELVASAIQSQNLPHNQVNATNEAYPIMQVLVMLQDAKTLAQFMPEAIARHGAACGQIAHAYKEILQVAEAKKIFDQRCAEVIARDRASMVPYLN